MAGDPDHPRRRARRARRDPALPPLGLLPLADQPPPERSDAARNRRALLDAADELVRGRGVEGVTMDAVAERAGVGKGTVFRRFGSREGVMAGLVDHREREWQERVLSGDPPLGPGAEPMARLLATGHSRIELNLTHARLIQAAGQSGFRGYAARSFTVIHVRHLLRELGVPGDLGYLATALMAPLAVPILVQQTEVEEVPLDRVRAGWDDLVARVTRGGAAGRR